MQSLPLKGLGVAEHKFIPPRHELTTAKGVLGGLEVSHALPWLWHLQLKSGPHFPLPVSLVHDFITLSTCTLL